MPTAVKLHVKNQVQIAVVRRRAVLAEVLRVKQFLSEQEPARDDIDFFLTSGARLRRLAERGYELVFIAAGDGFEQISRFRVHTKKGGVTRNFVRETPP